MEKTCILDGVLRGLFRTACESIVYHLWYSIFVKDLPEVPVFSPRRLPELECGDKGVLIGQPLWKHVSAEDVVQQYCCHSYYLDLGHFDSVLIKQCQRCFNN